MIRSIYVEESERKLRLEKPGRDVPLTRLALTTGLDTRTLAKIRNDENYRRPLYERQRFVKSMTPESCVVDIWRSNSAYFDLELGEPKKLSLKGKEHSFEQLVKDSVTSRGITPQSILNSLVQNKTVKFDEEHQSIELLEKIITPFKAGNAWGALDLGLLHVCSLIETVFHNFAAVKNKEPTYFQRGRWTHRLNIKDRVKFEKALTTFLEKSEDRAHKLIEQFEEDAPSKDHVTAGISMFYFEEDFYIN